MNGFDVGALQALLKFRKIGAACWTTSAGKGFDVPIHLKESM
jgi:uncharacterized protein (UPF0335 family)